MADAINLLLMGPPGAGKGTQAQFLVERLRIPQISTGEMLREAVASGEGIGPKVGELMRLGKLVPDSMVIEIVRERLSRADCRSGFILDGFPRTTEQAIALDALMRELGLTPLRVLLIEVPEEESVRRIRSRGQGRPDDDEATARDRLKVYRTETEPVIRHYGKTVRRIDGLGNVSQIRTRIAEALGLSGGAA